MATPSTTLKKPKHIDFMPPAAKIPLTITRRENSTLDGANLHEKIPKDRIRALILSDHLKDKWNQNQYNLAYVGKNYTNEKELLQAYLNQYDDHSSSVKVTYQKPKHKWGRAYPQRSLGLTSMSRITRNTLIYDLVIDCDIKNCQPELIRNICEDNDIPCDYVTEYCERRKDILAEVIETYNVDRWVAKQLFIRICFKGSFHSWCQEHQVENKIPLKFITRFQTDVETIAKIIKKKNPDLYKTCYDLQKAKNKTNYIGSCLSLFLQDYEEYIVSRMISWCKLKARVMPNNIGTYEFDGIKLWKENVNKYNGGIEKFLKDINEATKSLTGFDLVWEVKEIDEYFDITNDLEKIRESDKAKQDAAKELKELSDYFDGRMDNTGVIETIKEMKPNNYVYSKDVFYGWTGDKWIRSIAHGNNLWYS